MTWDLGRFEAWTIGWRGVISACGFGCLLTLCLPPFGYWPLLVPALCGLYFLADAATSPRAAFWIGWGFGLGHFTTGLYWIANALLIDAASFWWMVPFGVLGLPAFLAVFLGAALAARHWLLPSGFLRLLTFAAFWSLAELARGHLLTGFPWNLIGYAWWDRPEPLQAAALIGVYGLGFVTVLAASAPALLASMRTPRVVASLVLAILPLVALAGWGYARLEQASSAVVPDVRLRLVQPNISQKIKMSMSERVVSFERLLDLSLSPAAEPPTAILWPETATPFLLEREPGARAAIASLLAPGASAMIGTPRAVVGEDGRTRYFNGFVALDSDDLVRGVYDKSHLVPFGEYVPLRGILPIEAIANRDTDYAFGIGPRTIRVPGAPAVGPLICYEAIFPGAVLDPNDRPEWLLNLTNDAWYGASTGPYQHFVIVGVRAIEEGLPMVRVANSGISGVVDPYGRVRARLGLDVGGVIDAALPRSLEGGTVYTLAREWPLSIMLILIIFITFCLRRFQTPVDLH